MKKEYVENRRRLIELIDSMPHFTIQTLVKKFRKGHRKDDPMLIDPVMTIPELLEQMCEVGRLNFDAGFYCHPNKT
jgi:hypothetical protein